MAAALVQHIGATSSLVSGTTLVLSVSKTITTGNTIIVAFGRFAHGSSPTCADNLGNTYALDFVSTPSDATGRGIFSAPVTTGGSLTSITITHPTVTNRGMSAAEFSGVGTFVSTAGGDGYISTNAYGNFANSVTIPANGLVVGAVITNDDKTATFAAGAASGSPSTTVVKDDYNGTTADARIGFLHAIAGGSDVTTFTGQATWTTAAGEVGVGAIYNPSVVTPVWTTPADTVSMSTTPDLKFTSPVSAVKQHFQLQLDTANTFATGNLRTYDSSTSQTNWTYWDGASWTAMPSDGLPIAKSGNEVDYTVTSALSGATWYRRVRAGTLA